MLKGASGNCGTLFVGPAVHCLWGPEEGGSVAVEFLERAYILVDSLGSIVSFTAEEPLDAVDYAEVIVRHAKDGQFRCPGFVDCHTHAPQHENIGRGSHLSLLQWLEQITFPTERAFVGRADLAKFFRTMIDRYVWNGTTTACYYGTLHLPVNVELANAAMERGQRCFIGKVCMDCNAPPDYIESVDEAVSGTVELIHHLRNSALVRPIVTPRFAVSCTMQMMASLGVVARQHNCFVQTHLSEMLDECELVQNTYGMSYAQVYEQAGLLGPKTVMAHCIHLSDDEVRLLHSTDTRVAHCPDSNFALLSGCLNVRRLGQQGIKVGLGTDVSGGHSQSILDAMRHAILCSKAISFFQSPPLVGPPLSFKEAFYLATLGGARVLDLDVGTFAKGFAFDALLVDVNANPMLPSLSTASVESLLERFMLCGDDRNIVEAYVQGRRLK